MIDRVMELAPVAAVACALVMLAIPPARRRMIREMRQMYATLPGPHWLRITICVTVGVACAMIPGPLDEAALFAIIAAWNRWTRRGQGKHRKSRTAKRASDAGTHSDADMMTRCSYLAGIARGL